MTFLNPALAFGSAALLIPLVIHILNRSRFRTVEWGAMHLLDSVLKVNHKRFRIDQLILLLIRCAIPVLVALCLARPVLTGSRLLEGDGPASLVVVLDTSYSMDAVEETGTRFDTAVDAACEIIAAAGRGSEIAVILTGGRPTSLFDQPVFDSDAVIRRLKLQQAGYGASDMQGAVDAAFTTLAGMSNARRELLIISDFQPTDWDPIRANSAEAIRQQIESQPLKPELTLLQIGTQVRGNISVDSLDIPQRTFGVGQQLSVRANVRNHGDTKVDNVRVRMKLDGVESAISQISLAPNGTTQTLFPCTFETVGSHVMEVEVIADDPLKTDNRFAAAVTIWESIPVLLVDGDPRSQPLESETDYLSVALTPFTFGRVRLADLIETQTVQAKQIDEERLKATRVVVLANVSQLAEAPLAMLAAYVQNGGALLVCAGDKIDLNWYREKMFANGNGLLPLPFGMPSGKIDSTGNSARLVGQHFDHPALEFFNDPANGDFSVAEIRRWYQLSESESESDSNANETQAGGSDTDVTVIARLDTGDPFLVERRFGEGTVLQLATSCDADWTDLPLRPIYVPLMQQLITTMASQFSPPQNIDAGEPATALFSPEEATSTSFSMLTPNGTRIAMQSVAQGQLQLARFDGTQRPGVYTLSAPGIKTIHFVAETSREESNLNQLDKPALNSLGEMLGATLVESPANYLEQDRLRRHGREIWKYLLAVLLAFMVLELVLQQRFSRVRT